MAALHGARIGLADNWIRHIQDVRDRHRGILENMAPEHRADALVRAQRDRAGGQRLASAP